jgi:hypothetical protein
MSRKARRGPADRDRVRLIEQGANAKVVCTIYQRKPSGANGQQDNALSIPDNFREYPKYIAIKKDCQENENNIYIDRDAGFVNLISDNMGSPGPDVNMRTIQ